MPDSWDKDTTLKARRFLLCDTCFTLQYNEFKTVRDREAQGRGEGQGLGRGTHLKRSGILIVSLKGVNQRFWCHLT